MDNQEIQTIKDLGVCSSCNYPNLIWQDWRNRFRCGWCGKNYSQRAAKMLSRLSPEEGAKLAKERERMACEF